eukprot:3027198-Alexandrium_andersonii.AAC.1
MAYIHTMSHGKGGPVPHNMLCDYLDKRPGSVLQRFVKAHFKSNTRNGRDGPSWAHMLVELYVNPHLTSTRGGG